MKSVLFACAAAICATCCRGSVVIADFESAQTNALNESLQMGKEPFVDDAERAIYASLSQTNRRIKLSVSDEFATSGKKSLRCAFGRSYRTGFSLTIPETDMTPYDRLCIDVVNAGTREDEMDVQLAFDGEKVNDSIYRVLGKRQTFRAPPGKSVWTMELTRWPKKTDRTRISKIHFFALHPDGATLHFDRIRLLKAGEADVPGSCSAADEAKIAGFARAAAAEEAEKRAAAVADFRTRCAKAGVTQPDGVLVGLATSMDHVKPLSPTALRVVRPPKTVRLRLARGEYESVQVIVFPESAALEDVTVRAVGFPEGVVSCSVLGYVRTRFQSPYAIGRTVVDGPEPGAYHRSASFARPGWYPDPILSHVRSVRIGKETAQGFWVRVSCPRGQAKGMLSGELAVSAGGRELKRIPLSVLVNGFELPKVAAVPVAMNFNPVGGVGWMPTDADYEIRSKAKTDPAAPCNLWKKRKFEWTDFLADYLMPMDFLYRVSRDKATREPDYEILERLNRQGRLGPVNIAYWGKLGADDKALKNFKEKTAAYYHAIYDKYRELGIADRCYFYGNDELRPEEFPAIRRSARAIHEAFPGVPLLTTAKDPDFGIGTNSLDEVEWFCPLTGRYDFERAEKARAKGKKVWWYVCDGPTWCHANMHIENRPIDTRLLLGALTARFKADGFLYWQISHWYSPRPIGTDPFTDWVAASCFGFNGEGCLTAVGPDGIPLPTVRLENFRDGLEDLAYAKLLQSRVEKRGKDDALAQKARKLVAVPETLVKSLGNFSDDPRALYGWRNAMADLIEEIDEGR